MAFSTPSIRFLAAAIAIILLISPPHATAITCSDVVTYLSPCTTYLKSGSGTPPKPCCNGAGSLASATKSVTDKRAACGCLKIASKAFNPKPLLAKSLPANCGIKLPFEVSPSVDCSKIN